MELLTETEFTSAQELVRGVDLDGARRMLGRDRFIAWMATRGYKDLYFFNKGILGFDKMVRHLHGSLCEFGAGPEPRRRGYLIPRSHYKSSTITIGKTIWKLIRNPDERIGIFHEKATQAQQFLASIKHHFEHNALLRTCYPERIPPSKQRGWRWTVEAINIPRPREYPEPSIYAAGQTSALQGMHFTSMIWDDLIGEEAAANPEVMQKVIDWMVRAEALFVTPAEGQLDLIGTRWAHHDIYAWAMDEGYPSMEWFRRSAIEQGKPLFPEQFTMQALEEIAKKDFFTFSCQYLNEPTTGRHEEFSPSWLRYYQKTEEMVDGRVDAMIRQDEEREDDGKNPIPLGHLTVFIHADPGVGFLEGRAKAKGRHSRSAIQVVGLGHPRRIFLLESWAEQSSTDAFIDQILKYFKAYERLVSWITMEAHSWTKILRPVLLKRAAELGITLTEGRVQAYTKSANSRKEGRIRGLQPYFRNGQVFLEHGMLDFEREYRDFPSGRTVDLLDALAQGPVYWRFPDEEDEDRWDDNPPDWDYDEEEESYRAGRSRATGY